MRRTSRRICLASLLLVGVGIVGAALAWACTNNAAISVTPASGPPGTAVTVTGTQFTDDPVQISLGGGPSMATARGPTFTVVATIPANAPAETHTIVAVGPAGTGQAPFTVTGSRSPAAGSESGGSTGSPPTGEPGSGSTGATADGGDAARGGPSSVSTSGSTQAPARDGAQVGVNGPLDRSTTRQPVFRDSLAAVTGSGAADARPTGNKAPSQRSAAGDLWAGFDSPSRGALASALDHAEEPANVPMRSVVLMLLALGAALGGIGIAGARRRSRSAARQRSLD